MVSRRKFVGSSAVVTATIAAGVSQTDSAKAGSQT